MDHIKQKRKRLILLGFFSILMGILFTIFGQFVVEIAFELFGFVLFIISAFNLIVIPFRWLKKKEKPEWKDVLQHILGVIVGLVLINYALFQGIAIAFIIAFYMLIMGCIRIFNFILIKNAKVSGYYSYLWSGIIYIGFGLNIINIKSDAEEIYFLLGLYLIFLGLMYLGDARELTKPHRVQKGKRKIRVGVPIIFTALTTHDSLKQFMDNDADNKNSIDWANGEKKTDELADLEVWIHTSTKKGFDAVGHADISYKGITYSYGNYNVDSLKLFGTVGDGILWEMKTEDYEKWIHKIEGRSVFKFGLRLTDEQKQIVEEQIQYIKDFTIPFKWETQTQKDSYIGQLNDLYGITVYKFEQSRFKTYFVLTTNCVLLADTIIGETGIDVVSRSGMITPGAYFDYFNNEFEKSYSNVITRSAVLNQSEMQKIESNQ